MNVSDNGWPGIDRDKTKSVRVPGTDLILRVAPQAAWIMSTFAGRFHDEVESLSGGQLDDWSYAWRNVRGSTTHLSCHASGTGMDLNALMHVRGVRGTYGATKLRALRALLDDFKDPKTGISVIKWGGDFAYPSIVDEMHFQIRGDADALKRVQVNLTKATLVEAAKKEDELPTPKEVWTDAKFKEYADHDKNGIKDEMTPAQMLWHVDSAVQRIEAALAKLTAALANK